MNLIKVSSLFTTSIPHPNLSGRCFTYKYVQLFGYEWSPKSANVCVSGALCSIKLFSRVPIGLVYKSLQGRELKEILKWASREFQESMKRASREFQLSISGAVNKIRQFCLLLLCTGTGHLKATRTLSDNIERFLLLCRLPGSKNRSNPIKIAWNIYELIMEEN